MAIVLPTITPQGTWSVNGFDTGLPAQGITPQFQFTNAGVLQISYDKGATWVDLTAIGFVAVPPPPPSGTFGLRSIDGVLTWV